MPLKRNRPCGIKQKENVSSIGIVDGRDMERTRCSKTQTLSMSMAERRVMVYDVPCRCTRLVSPTSGAKEDKKDALKRTGEI
jgi:hypothetical protein